MAGRFMKLASGSLFGAGIGTAIAILYAPQSGQELRHKVRSLWHQAKVAGIEAQAETELALIGRFRELTGHDDQLQTLEKEARERRETFLNQMAAEGALVTSAAETSTRTTPVATTTTDVHVSRNA